MKSRLLTVGHRNNYSIDFHRSEERGRGETLFLPLSSFAQLSCVRGLWMRGPACAFHLFFSHFRAGRDIALA
jgi:hypothetical protein